MAYGCVEQSEGLDGLPGLPERLQERKRETHHFKVVIFEYRIAGRGGLPDGSFFANGDAVAVEKCDEVLHLPNSVRLVLQIFTTLDFIDAIAVLFLNLLCDVNLELASMRLDKVEALGVDGKSLMLKVGRRHGEFAAMKSLRFVVGRAVLDDLRRDEVRRDAVFHVVTKDQLLVLFLGADDSDPVLCVRIVGVEGVRLAVNIPIDR